jgi:hypothetical protein
LLLMDVLPMVRTFALPALVMFALASSVHAGKIVSWRNCLATG